MEYQSKKYGPLKNIPSNILTNRTYVPRKGWEIVIAIVFYSGVLVKYEII